MADVIDRRPSGGGASAANTLYKDEGDGSFPEAVSALARGWDATDLAWERLLVNNTTGGLEVHVVGGSAAGTEYNVDDVAGAADAGTLALVVRDDSLTTLGVADGDYTQLRVSATGALHVTGGGGGTEYTEDVATADPIVGTATLMERDDALSAVTPIEGDWIGLRGTAEGALWTQDFNSDAILADTANMDTNLGTIAGAVVGTEMQVDIVAVTPDLALGTDISDVFGTASVLGGGTEAGAVRVTVANDSTGVVSVDDNAGSLTVDSGAAFTVQEDGAALTALQLIDDVVYTDDTSTHATGTSKGAGIMAAATPTDAAIEANDIGMLAMSLDRRLHVDADITAQSAGDITIADGGNNISVDWAGTVPPIGAGTEAAALRVTVATDSTGVLSIDDNAGSLTVDGTVTADAGTGPWPVTDNGGSLTVDSGAAFTVQEDGAALTALQIIDNPVFADDAAFTLATSSVMVGGAIRDDALTTLTAVEGDAVPLRVGSTGALHVTGGGGGTEYTQDDATTDPATGSTFLMVRDDSPASQESADNDWTVPRATQYGAQYVQVVDSSGSFVDSFGGGSAPSHADDSGFTVATDNVSPIGAMLDDTATDSVDEGDVGVLRMTADRQLKVDASGTAVPVTDNGGNLSVDWGGTVPPIGAGTEAAALRVTLATDSTGVVSVDDNGSTLSVDDGAGSLTVDNAALSTLSTQLVAHDAVDAGNPLKVGQKAVALKATPTAVAAADRTDWIAQRNGVPYVIGGHPNVIAFEYNTTAAQTDDAIIPSIAAGTAIVLTSIEATVDNATTVDVGVRVGFGTATLTAEGASGADAVSAIVLSHPGIAAGSGITKGNGGGIIGIGASGAELRVTNEVPTTGKLRITGTYYTASI